MAAVHGHIWPQFERARVRQALHDYSYYELHERALFWRLAIPGVLLFWACVAYAIYSLTQDRRRCILSFVLPPFVLQPSSSRGRVAESGVGTR